MEARASAKYLRGSAQKARLVVDMIRGKRVGEALAILRFTQKRAAQSVEKCLRSAIANATEAAERQNVAVDPDELFVKACFVDMGPTKHRRRVRPAPQGRAYREQRHFCHVTVLVSSDEREKAPAGRARKPAPQGGMIDPNGGSRKPSKKAAAEASPKKQPEQPAAPAETTESAAPEATTE
jgi:large subunit ribosomal protein L22